MPDQTTEARAPTAELARLREENLRLRDLLIAKDAELGSLKGQVAALEAGTARLLNIVGRAGAPPGSRLRFPRPGPPPPSGRRRGLASGGAALLHPHPDLRNAGRRAGGD